ncbi:MAG TPA: kelch repeat-containing protein [Candidatus Dormibacteraeota bacterium]|nr:kelch repeat-containing protein [Candidatus Dormibacteraeota bacterium]
MTTAGRSGLASLAALAITAVSPGAANVTAAGNPWSPAARMVQAHEAATATLLANRKVLVVGSWPDLNTGAELYDPALDTWSPTGPMVVPRALGTATLLPSGKVLIAGGITADTGHSTTRTELYDPETNSWFSGENMAVQRSSHTATLLSSGKVLVAGGQNASGYIATAELYDPVSNHWTMAAPMEAGYAGARATLLANGTVLLAGGATLGDARAELYDPATNRWSNAGTAARNTETMTRLTDGRVLITGQGKEANLYNPATNRWSVAAAMLQDRVAPSATRIADGRVLVAGGSTTIGGQQVWLTSAEIYDPKANRWSPAGCMAQARWEQTATLVSTRLLVAGGSVPPAALSSAEMFDPGNESASQLIDFCPTASAGQSAVDTPSPPPSATVAAPSASSTGAATQASVRPAGELARLTGVPGVGTLTVSRVAAVGIVAGVLVLLALAIALLLRARSRRRGI